MKIKYILLIVITPLLFGCEAFHFFEEEGPLEEKEFILDNYTELKILNIMDVELIPSSENKMVILCDRNKMKRISIQQNGQSVALDHSYENWSGNFEHIKAKVHYSKLNHIQLKSPCNLIGKILNPGAKTQISVYSNADLVESRLEVQAKEIKLMSYGKINGNYEFTGECEAAYFVLNGSMSIRASELKTLRANIGQNGIAEAHVWAEDALNLTIWNTGNIYYRGNPDPININRRQINNQSPTGKVIKIGE